MKANLDITENFYGKWWDVIDQEFPGYFDEDKDEVLDESTPAQPPLRNKEPALPTSSRPTRFAPARSTDQNSQQRQSHDPQVRWQQEEEVKLDSLVVKGLTIDDGEKLFKKQKGATTIGAEDEKPVNKFVKSSLQQRKRKRNHNENRTRFN